MINMDESSPMDQRVLRDGDGFCMGKTEVDKPRERLKALPKTINKISAS